MSRILADAQIQAFEDQGYLSGLSVFSTSEMDAINAELPHILDLLHPGETTKEIREWHEASSFLLDLCLEDRILDYVEDLIGPDFYMWASNFFIKEPHTASTVSWHQDAYYWPLRPLASVTVWLAFDDVDEENGAMMFLPGSHKNGIVTHNRIDGDSVLSLEANVSDFDLDTAVRVDLKRGQVSIHNDQLLHASPANRSARRRAAFTIRYSPNHVKCDLSINPHFKIYPARGAVCDINPHGPLAAQRYGRLDRNHLSIEESGQEKEATFWNKPS